jgi:AcrR family transcriptional regulator
MDEAAPARRTRLTAEQRRVLILNAATEVFTAVGYRAAKVSEIAARVGVTEPVIFQNFGSKGALYAAVLDRVSSQIQADLHALAGAHGSVLDLLGHVLSPHPARAPRDAGLHRGVLFADAAALAADPGLGEPARQVARTLAGHLADLLRQGQADGTIRSDVDPAAAAWLLMSVLSSRPFRTGAMPDSKRSERKVATLVRQMLSPPGPLRSQLPERHRRRPIARPAGS